MRAPVRPRVEPVHSEPWARSEPQAWTGAPEAEAVAEASAEAAAWAASEAAEAGEEAAVGAVS